MKPIFKSIRWRLQIWHGALLIVVLIAFGLRLYSLDRKNRLQLIDQELQRQLIFVATVLKDSDHSEAIREAATEALSQTGTADSHSDSDAAPEVTDPKIWHDSTKQALLKAVIRTGTYYVCWGPDDEVLFRSDDVPADIAPPPKNDDLLFLARSRGENREQILMVSSGLRLLVGRSVTKELAQMKQVVGQKVGAGFVVMALGLVGGWWLAARATKPIKDISEAAQKIASGNLAERINISDTDSELGQLASILNRSFDHVQEAFSELQNTLDHQARFVADASHELRTPVASVLAEASSALAAERSPEEYREALEACGGIARRMRRLVEALLLLARMDSREQTSKQVSCDLAEIVGEAVRDFTPAAADQAINLELDASAVRCSGHPELLRLVAVNLVDNAIHYNRPNGRVAIKVHQNQTAAFISVEDNGQGIPEESLPHIFERFYRVDESRSPTSGRFGLGLAITKLIVEAHSGEITATSIPDVGTTFVVRLPLDQSDHPETPET